MLLSLPTVVLVALGGALGSTTRYAAGLGCTRWLGAGYPYGTLLVNVLGCFLMGLAFAGLKPEWRPLVGVGFLGGFTTFSAFALENWQMLERGELLAAGGYTVLSVLLSLGALMAGVMLVKLLTA
jgi:fluoride exporter